MADQQTGAAEQAATEQAQAAQASEQQAAGEQQQPDVLAQLESRINDLPGQIAEQLAQQQMAQGDPWEAQFGPLDGADPYAQQIQAQAQQQGQQVPGAEQVAQAQQQMAQQGYDWTNPQAVAQYIQEQVQTAVQSATYPDQIGKVLDRYPELKTDQAVADAVVQRIAQAGFDPRQNIPPAVLEMAYKAHKADQIADQQTQSQQANPGQQAQLEQGGASPQADEGPSVAEQLFGPRPQQTKSSAFGWAVK